MNYYDILLAKKLEDNRDPQVVGLSVTENGTYSEEGKVYKPVVVNVPLPSNAYLLQTIEHESIATFADGTDNFLKSLEVAIEPIQSGSGDPSPTNIRSISGHTEANVSDSISINEEIESGSLSNDGLNVVNPMRIRTKNYISVKPNTTYLVDWDSDSITYFGLKGYTVNDFTTTSIQTSDWIAKGSTFITDANVNYIRTNFRNSSGIDIYPSELSKLRVTPISNYYNIQLGDTYYGATIDVVSGVLTVDRGIVDLGNLTYTYDSVYRRFASIAITNLKQVDVRTLFMASTCYKCMWHNESISNIPDCSFYNSNNESNIYIHDSRFDNATDLKNALSGQKVLYPLATPTTIQLTPTIIKSLQGENNFFADSGEIKLLQYFGKETA